MYLILPLAADILRTFAKICLQFRVLGFQWLRILSGYMGTAIIVLLCIQLFAIMFVWLLSISKVLVHPVVFTKLLGNHF